MGDVHPHDQEGYFYIPCVKDEILSSTYRECHPTSGVILSAQHSSKFLALEKTWRSMVSSVDKKYRSIMANVGVCRHSGSQRYYFEVWVDKKASYNNNSSSIGNFRIGIGEYFASLQAPIGYDQYGYGFRDVDGSKVHRSVRQSYSSNDSSGFGMDDVVGCFLEFPEKSHPFTTEPYSKQSRIPIKYKGSIYFEVKDETYSTNVTNNKSGIPASQLDWLKFPTDKEMSNAFTRLQEETDKLLSESYGIVSFFVNGKCQGEAYKVPIDKGQIYYPYLSLYGKISLQFNPGPIFVHPPDIESTYSPWSTAFSQSEVENCIKDIVEDIVACKKTVIQESEMIT